MADALPRMTFATAFLAMTRRLVGVLLAAEVAASSVAGGITAPSERYTASVETLSARLSVTIEGLPNRGIVAGADSLMSDVDAVHANVEFQLPELVRYPPILLEALIGLANQGRNNANYDAGQ